MLIIKIDQAFLYTPAQLLTSYIFFNQDNLNSRSPLILRFRIDHYSIGHNVLCMISLREISDKLHKYKTNLKIR